MTASVPDIAGEGGLRWFSNNVFDESETRFPIRCIQVTENWPEVFGFRYVGGDPDRLSGKFCKNGLSGRRRRRQNADSGKLRKTATNRRRLPGFSEEFIRKKRCLHGSSARNYHLRHHVLYRGERCRTQSENRGRSDPENPGDRRRFDETYPAPYPARRILCDGLHQRLPRKRQSRDHLVADRRRHSDSRDRRHQFGQFRDRTDTDPRTKPERS